MQRIYKKDTSISFAQDELGLTGKTSLTQCPKCHKIMAVSNRGVNCSHRGEGHHEHMHRCNPGMFIERFVGYFLIVPYSTTRMKTWIWKLE